MSTADLCRIVVVVACALSVACSSGEAPRQEARDAAGEPAADGREAAGPPSTGAVVEPVTVEVLQSAFPRVAGWEQRTATGERVLVPVAFAQAEADYANGPVTVTLRVVDSAFNEVLVAPWAVFLEEGHETRTGDAYERAVTVAGHPAFERFSAGSGDGELNIVVGRRFLVSIEGDNVSDMAVLHQFASAIDTTKWPLK